MKVKLTIIIGIFVFCLCFYQANELITWVLTQFPQSAHEWLGVIRIVIWILSFTLVSAISYLVAIFSAGIIAILLGL
jgi:uncharacterized protein involved in cysteine biosynthesis